MDKAPFKDTPLWEFGDPGPRSGTKYAIQVQNRLRRKRVITNFYSDAQKVFYIPHNSNMLGGWQEERNIFKKCNFDSVQRWENNSIGEMFSVKKSRTLQIKKRYE